jgi:drug/metabolite transporter (DMT)-like permease
MTIPARAASGSSNSAIAILIISSILWGSSFVSIKIGLEYVNPYDFVFLRLAVASAIMVSTLFFLGRMRLSVFKEGSVWILGLLNGVAFSLQYIGLLYTTAGKTALLVNLNVIIVALLSWRMFGESIGWRKILGVALGVVGAAMIATNGDLSSLMQGEIFGDMLVFSAGIVWAFFIVLHKRILSRSERSVIELSAVVMLVTAVALLPIAAVFGGLNLVSVSLAGWSLVAFTAIVCTVLPYALWIFALKAVTATVSSIVSMVEVASALILSAILLREAYNAVAVVGAIVILVSITAVARS